MRHLLLPIAVVLLPGCDLFDQGKDLFEGLTNPLVVQGIVLGIEAPESDEIDLSGTDFEEGTAASVFLADAADAGDLDNAPVGGAEVSVGPVGAAEQTAGVYLVDPTDGLVYGAGSTMDLKIEIGKDTATGRVTLPPPPNLSVAQTHTANQAMTLQLGQTYNTAIVAVIDQDGNLTYSNEPSTIGELYDMTGNGSVTSVEVPGEAFPTSGAYAVGIAGMNSTRAADLTNMNTALSNVMAGKMRFGVTVVP